MKVLRIVSDLYPSVVGGLPLHAHEISKWQANIGYDVTVYTSQVDNSPIQEYRDGYRIVRISPVFRVMGNSIMPSLLFKLLNSRNDFDLMHAHSHLFFSTNVSALVRKIGALPLVITNHGLTSQTVPSWIHNLFIPTVAKWTFKLADRVICYTEDEKAKVVALGIAPTKVAVIHNGVDTELFSPLGQESNSQQILWIGRFVLGKGIEYLFEAFKQLVHQHQEISLLLIGRGPLKAHYERMIRELSLNNRVMIKDFVPNDELPAIYRASSIFVLPSIYEGMPRTLIEAMSCGIPVVCTRLPQLTETVKGSGLLVNTRDSRALAEAISMILSDTRLREKLGGCGRQKVIKSYSWQDTIQKTVELYRELVGGDAES